MTPQEEALWVDFLRRADPGGSLDLPPSTSLDPLPGECCGWHAGWTRRRLLGVALGAVAAAVTSPYWFPRIAHAQGVPWNVPLPRPIPSGRRPPFAPEIFFHEFPPGRGVEPSTITDFRGYFGTAFMRGTGKRTNKKTGETGQSPYQATMRFLKGTYVAVDGKEYAGTFTFT